MGSETRQRPAEARYFYVINYLHPRPGLGAWAFQIELSMEMARWLWAYPLPDLQHFKQDLRERLADVRLCSGIGGVQPEPFLDYPRLNFWDDRCLLTNISVPGNACGLDMDPRDYDYVKQENPLPEFQRVRLLPHNVDSMLQAVSLISLFTGWAECACAIAEKSSKQHQPKE